MSQPNIVVLGLGNLLLGDEGLGIRALESLQARYELPDAITCLDGGVMGLELLAYLTGTTHLLVIDAIETGQPPGTLVRLEGEQIPKTLSQKLSLHEISFQDLLALNELRGMAVPHLVVWGLVPAILDPGVRLSEPVEVQLDTLVEAVIGELQNWGVTPSSRSTLVESASRSV